MIKFQIKTSEAHTTSLRFLFKAFFGSLLLLAMLTRTALNARSESRYRCRDKPALIR